MVRGFENFKKIQETPGISEQQRLWLEDYQGLTCSKALNKKHFVKWATKPLFYDKEKFTAEINCIGRKKDRLVIEFDGDGEKAKADFEETKIKLQNLGIAYIHSSHGSLKSDYLWVEFERDLNTDEAKNFLCWIAPEGSEVDLNFTSDKKVYPVLFAIHWKYSNRRELPVTFFGGDKINYEELKIPKVKIKTETRIGDDGFEYKTFTKESIRERVLSLFQRKMFGEGTEILVAAIKSNNYIYTTKVDKANEVYIYDEGIYVPEGESEIKEQLRKIMGDNYSEWIANQVMAKIKADTGIASDKFFKDSDLYEIPVTNGILDLKTLELLPFNHEKIFFSKLPVRYEPGATCEMIDKFLTDVLSSPTDKEVFYELVGFGLVKDYFLEKSFMFVGNGRNGKSKSIELLKRLVGVGNCASVPLSAITSDSPFVERLWKRFFNLAGDISSKDLKETGMFKQLTGRDPISANRKYKNVVEFCNYAKMVFACNELPKVYDYSDGFWERWVLMEFPYKFVDQNVFDGATEKERKNWKIKNPNIIDEITTDEEMSGFLNMALLGLFRLFEKKKFSYTIGTAEVKEKWIRMADSFMAFCMDSLEEDYDAKIRKKDLRKEYKKYCTLHKVGGVSDRAIKATLQEMFGVSEEYTKNHEFAQSQEWHWSGVKLTKNEGNDAV